MSITRMLIALGLAVSSTRADVVVVPGGASGAQELMRAIAAAAPGDVLLLEPGDYEQEFVMGTYLISKGITLVPAPGAAPIILGPVQIMGVPDGQTVLLRGFEVHPFEGGTGLSLDIWGILGSNWTAWIEDCTFGGKKGTALDPGWPASGSAGGVAAWVYCTSAVFRHCTFRGGAGGDATGAQFCTAGGNALNVYGVGKAALHDCTLVGGAAGSGHSASLTPGDDSGDALSVAFSEVMLSGCTLTGGLEGADNDSAQGTSGSAIGIGYGRSSVSVQHGSLEAGAVQGAGSQGPAISGDASHVHTLSEPVRTLVLPALVHEGEIATMLLDGEPGDAAFLLVSAQATALLVPRLEGMLALSQTFLAGPVAVGVLSGPDGKLSVPLSVQVPPGVEGLSLFAQGLIQDADGASLGGVSAITWVAAGF